ncbi:MAG: hypothetical protein IH960_13025 [Chloroflexi bacterium]|nr:hypothetical protein [Chloroflexota bacterium]
MPDNITIENDFASVIVSPGAGASVRSISVRKNGAAYELLAGGEDEHHPTLLPSGTGSFIMAPWVNRIRDGRLVAPDGVHGLPVNAPPHAMHGLVRELEWSVRSTAVDSVDMVIELADPWPYKGRVEYSIALDGRALLQTMRLVASPEETRAFPGGVGWHPWFNRSLGTGESSVQADVASQWELDDTMTALGTRSVTNLVERLNKGTFLDTGEVDGCFLARPGGKAVLSWPELTLTMTSSETVTHLMFYSPEHAICVEPQTSTIDAAQLDERGITDTGHILVDQINPLVATTTWSWK